MNQLKLTNRTSISNFNKCNARNITKLREKLALLPHILSLKFDFVSLNFNLKIAIGFLPGITGYAGYESARFARYSNSERFEVSFNKTSNPLVYNKLRMKSFFSKSFDSLV